jgi:hypothetical protein
MKGKLKHMFLGIPIIIWLLQLLYVALALSIFIVFFSADKGITLGRVLFLIVVIIINVIWRLAIRGKIKF